MPQTQRSTCDKSYIFKCIKKHLYFRKYFKYFRNYIWKIFTSITL